MWRNHSTVLRYTLFGALFGLAFPVFSTLAELLAQGLPLTMESLAQVQKSAPLLWVIDTAPLFLGLFANLAGRRQEKSNRLNMELNQRIQERDQAISQLQTLQTDLEERIMARTRDLERRSSYLRAAAEVGRAAASILEIDRLMRQVVELIRQWFNLYYVGLFRVDPANEWAVLRAGTGDAGKVMLARHHRIKIGEGMIGWSIANAQARIASQAETDAVRLSMPELPLTRSEAALPLRLRGQVLGALTVQSAHPHAFDADILTALEAMADQVAVALDNARLFAEREAVMNAQRRSRSEATRSRWDQMLRTRSGLGFFRDKHGISSTVDPVTHTADQSDESRQLRPIRVRDQVIGIVDARKPPGAHKWSEDEIGLLESLLEQLGLALEDAQLYQETQRRAQREQVQRQIIEKVRAAPDVESVARTAAEQLVKALGGARGFVKLEKGHSTTEGAP